MTRIVALLGSDPHSTASDAAALAASDRGALALAMNLWQRGGDLRVYATDPAARCYARAAGAGQVAHPAEPSTADFDIALVGRGACAEDGDAMPARLAEACDAALVYEVLDAGAEADALLVTRDLGCGARDVLFIRGPCVLVVSDEVARAPYVSRYRLAAAAEEDSGAAERAAREPWRPAPARVRLGDLDRRVGGPALDRMNALFGLGGRRSTQPRAFRGSGEECARQLVRYLSHHGFVERVDPTESDAAPAMAESRPTRASLPGAHTAVSLPARVLRRPRAEGRSPGARGPFQIGVDV